MTPIRVLVVDDSAFARKVVREVLAGAPDIEVVGIARDGVDALEKIIELAPDVVTLDLVMPNLDGVSVLQSLPPPPNRPAVVVVSIADEDGELGVAALAAGAFDVVKKPTALALDALYGLSDELRAKVIAAGRWKRSGGTSILAPAPASAPAPTSIRPGQLTRTKLLVLGASTGGPQALTRVLSELPADFPVPIALVIHMPQGYTEAFARRLDADSALDVIEARDGLVLRAGQAVVARAGVHLAFETAGAEWQAKLELSPIESVHRPSVDVLFTSAAKTAGAETLAVVLTGMGSDGLAGARAVRAAGGRVLTESEHSCVVYGMPRVVVEAGLSNGAAPIHEMAALILQSL